MIVMGGDPEFVGGRPSWHEAATRATLTPYRPVGAVQSWAGGFGGAPGEPATHLEVISVVDGVEVSVDTFEPDDRQHLERWLSLAVTDLVFNHVLGRTELSFPFDISVVADDRELTVDNADRVFRGVRIDGTARWVGLCDLGWMRLRVTTYQDAPLQLLPLDDLSALPWFPPDGR